jgi:hypothetical protein
VSKSPAAESRTICTVGHSADTVSTVFSLASILRAQHVTTAPNNRILADFARDAVYFELLAPARVVAWADSLIATSKLPPPWLLDLSLVNTSDTLAVCAALRAVPGDPDLKTSLQLLNALVLREWRMGHLTIGQVRGIGWKLYRDEFENGDAARWGIVVECRGELLDDGYVSADQMRAIIDDELARFELDLQCLPSWT